MIINFGNKTTEDVYHGIVSKQALKIPQTVWSTAQRKLDLLDAAMVLKDLRVPPGNRLEALRGRFSGKLSIRINDQYRVVFIFKDGQGRPTASQLGLCFSEVYLGKALRIR